MSGSIDADNKTDTIRKLERMGLVPISITTAEEPVARIASPALKTCGQAVTSLLLGILSLVLPLKLLSFFLSVPAVIFGHAALSQINKRSLEIGGKGIARAGLILGYLSIAFLFFSIATAAFKSERESVSRAPVAVTHTPAHSSEPEERFSDVLARSVSESVRESVREDHRRAELVQPASDFPNVLPVLGTLYENEGFGDTGRYSRDQQEQIFTERFKGNQYFVHGEITDVGTTAFGGRKYITIMVTKGHYFDVYPSDDFDLLAFSKGQRIGFVGTWTSLGTGIIVKHKMDNAVDPSATTRTGAPKESRGPQIPSDQAAFGLRLREFKASYLDVLKFNNDLRTKEVTDVAKAFIDEKRMIQGWVGTVQGVADSLGSSWVKVTADGVEYNLWPPDKGFFEGNDPLPIFRSLGKGQIIRFSGEMTGSMRLTTAGTISDPSMKINPMSIEIIQ